MKALADGDAKLEDPEPGMRRSHSALRWLLLAVAILSVATGFMLRDVLRDGGVPVSTYRIAMFTARADDRVSYRPASVTTPRPRAQQ